MLSLAIGFSEDFTVVGDASLDTNSSLKYISFSDAITRSDGIADGSL